MSVLARIRVFRPEPDPALAVFAEGPELDEDDLEQVVGGLERVFIPGAATAGS